MKLFSVSSSALMLVLVSLLAAAQFCQSLAPMSKMPSQKRASATRLGMAPKYIGNKWVPQTDDDLPSAGYDAVGTLLRQGPKPFLTRVFQADEWEQAVLKFMATENGGKGCDRNTAQGNMDAYLRNPQDWQFARMEDAKNGYQRDYATLRSQDLLLVLVWSAVVAAVVGRAAYSIANGVDFYAFGPFTGSY